MVLTTLSVRLKSLQKKKDGRIHYNVKKLKDPNTLAAFQAEIEERLAPLLADNAEKDDLASEAESNLKAAAKAILGKERLTKHPWINEQVLQKCDERREKKKVRFKSRRENREYQTVNREVKQAIKDAKEQWIQQECSKIEAGIRSNNTKQAFQTLKTLTHSSTNQITCIEDADGNLLTAKTDIVKRWEEYCQELYNFQLTAEEGVLQDLKSRTCQFQEDDEPDILEFEVTAVIKALKQGKSPGIYNVPAELLNCSCWSAAEPSIKSTSSAN